MARLLPPNRGFGYKPCGTFQCIGAIQQLTLFPWPSDRDGVFLDLYIKHRLTIEESRVDDELFLVELALPEDLEFNKRVEVQSARKISQSLLYFGIECWSQNTRRWSSNGESGPLAEGGAGN